MKTYSVLIAYADHDPEQGEYGATVRAETARKPSGWRDG